MLHECPNCREPVGYWRMFRTPAWGSFRCKACGSVLAISFARRIAACGVWLVLLLIAVEGFGFFRGLPWFVAYPVMIGSLLAALFVGEKLVLLERRAFTCRKCGYDLQGLPTPRCPECGTGFDPAERERVLARIHMPPPKPRHRWIAVLVVILLALSAAVGLVVYKRAASGRARITPASSPAATSTASQP